MAKTRASSRTSTRGTRSRSGASSAPLRPFTVDHFCAYAERLVYDDGKRRPLEDWQITLAADVFAGYRRNLWIVPEGNGKTTLVALIALYGADYSESPWIPVGAAAAKQAKITYQQASGFVNRTPGMAERFKCLDGVKVIRSIRNPGPGIEIFAHDPNTGDGVIPYPWALLDELHRHPDMRLWDLWAGKLRKRGGQIIGITTGGEPETPFENMRDGIRLRAASRERSGAYLRAEAPGEVLHEWMVQRDEECSDMARVKEANPLSLITEATLAEDYALVTDLGDWKRLKCNRPTRSSQSAISDAEWDGAETDERIPAGEPVTVGMDVAFKWDCTAAVPDWWSNGHVLGDPLILTPPRDGSSIHPDDIKDGLLEMADLFRIEALVMDIHRAEDIAAWIEDELGIRVFDHAQQKSSTHVQDYDAFTKVLRNGRLRHTGDHELRAHVLNAIARRLPGGDYRFDRPSVVRANARAQDKRVIDGLTAAAMVVEHDERERATPVSVYEQRALAAQST